MLKLPGPRISRRERPRRKLRRTCRRQLEATKCGADDPPARMARRRPVGVAGWAKAAGWPGRAHTPLPPSRARPSRAPTTRRRYIPHPPPWRSEYPKRTGPDGMLKLRGHGISRRERPRITRIGFKERNCSQENTRVIREIRGPSHPRDSSILRAPRPGSAGTKEGRYDTALWQRSLRAAASPDRGNGKESSNSADPQSWPRLWLEAARSVRIERALSKRPSLDAPQERRKHVRCLAERD